MPECNRCGRCCYFQDEYLEWKPCRYLRFGLHKAKCSIYKRRLGALIYRFPNGTVGVCMKRRFTLHDFPGCPYNTDRPFPPGEPPLPKNSNLYKYVDTNK